MSESERLKKEFEKARYNENAYALRLIKGNLDRQRNVFHEQGNKYFYLKDYDQAIEAYKNVLFIARLTEDTIEIKSALIDLANAYATAYFNAHTTTYVTTDYLRHAMECYDEATGLNIKILNEKGNAKTPRNHKSEVSRLSYLDRWLLVQSKRFYIVVLIVSLLIFIVVGLATFFTKIPLLLYTLQLPIILLYVMSHYFLKYKRNDL